MVAEGVDGVLARMDTLRAKLDAVHDPNRFFLGTYSRTTRAVGQALRDGWFEDPEWVDRWDVAFAALYLDALEAFEADPATAPRPWRAALGADAALHPLRLVLLGMNAHINYDLPQALLAVITDDEFGDPVLMDRRRRDHERIDAVLASRVAGEAGELAAAARDHPGVVRRPPALRAVDHLTEPLNRAATRRFLAESRRKVWANTLALQEARAGDTETYRRRLAELAVLSTARIADLLAPGNVILKLAAGGFGVLLPPD